MEKKPDGYFSQERLEIIDRVPNGVDRILDIGCGEGMLGRGLKERGIGEVIGIEIDETVAKKASFNMDNVITGDVEGMDIPYSEGYFDLIIFADILEHLRDPWTVLARCLNWVSADGFVMASIPNVRYIGVMNNLVEGYWRYEDHGILDRGHLRFFTLESMMEMITVSGLSIMDVAWNINDQYEKYTSEGIRYPVNLNIGRMTINNLDDFELRDIFIYQYILTAKKGKLGEE